MDADLAELVSAAVPGSGDDDQDWVLEYLQALLRKALAIQNP